MFMCASLASSFSMIFGEPDIHNQATDEGECGNRSNRQLQAPISYIITSYILYCLEVFIAFSPLHLRHIIFDLLFLVFLTDHEYVVGIDNDKIFEAL